MYFLLRCQLRRVYHPGLPGLRSCCPGGSYGPVPLCGKLQQYCIVATKVQFSGVQQNSTSGDYQLKFTSRCWKLQLTELGRIIYSSRTKNLREKRKKKKKKKKNKNINFYYQFSCTLMPLNLQKFYD